MGLDMYLSKKSYVKNWTHMKAKEKHSILIKKGGKVRTDIDPKKINYVVEEAGYWRKANAIHGWFVDNVQGGEDDCGEYEVIPQEMEKLLKVISRVLKNKKLAPELLPIRSGFFFGNYDPEKGYDEYYFDTLKETKKILTEALKHEDASYCYQSSW